MRSLDVTTLYASRDQSCLYAEEATLMYDHHTMAPYADRASSLGNPLGLVKAGLKCSQGSRTPTFLVKLSGDPHARDRGVQDLLWQAARMVGHWTAAAADHLTLLCILPLIAPLAGVQRAAHQNTPCPHGPTNLQLLN